MLLGWELPNRTNGEVTDEEWARFDALDARIAKVRPYHLTPGTLFKLAQRQAEIVLRPNADGAIDVATRVLELRRATKTLVEWRFPKIVILPDSEPNLGSLPYKDGYWQDVAAVVVGLRDLLGPSVLIASPPMAVGQREGEWYAAAGDLMGAWGLIGAHGYGQSHTGLLDTSIAMAIQFGLPVIFDEVGDSTPSLTADQRAMWLRTYLDRIAAAGAYAACLFILGSDDAEWQRFILTSEQCTQLRRAPEAEGTMPQPTFVTIDPIAPVRPGETFRVSGVAGGIDGPQRSFIVFAAYPQKDASTNWGQDGKIVVPSHNGAFGFDITLGPANYPIDAPLTGTLRIQSLELTPDEAARGGDWGEAPVFTAPFTILPSGAAEPAQPVDPAQPAPVPVAANQAAIDLAYYHITNGYNALVEAKDAVGAEQMKRLELHYLHHFKGEGASDPFAPRR